MTKSPLQVFQAFGEGLMSGTDAWKEVVSADVTFSGPVDQVSGLEAFAQLNQAFLPIIKGTKLKQAHETGDYVVTQVEFQLATPSGNEIILDMAEWYEIKAGKIKSIKVYYDAEEFRKEMAISI